VGENLRRRTANFILSFSLERATCEVQHKSHEADLSGGFGSTLASKIAALLKEILAVIPLFGTIGRNEVQTDVSSFDFRVLSVVGES
jgi:hypothetical protein